MTIYASLADPANLVAVLKMGGGHIFSKHYEYFQALSVGNNIGLNGFRKNRYAGSTIAYGGLELKFKIAEIDSYILPGPLGITVFYNAALARGGHDPSKKWHGAYGVGIYYLPFNLFAITGSIGFSKSEKMASFSLGTRINLSY
jgi:hypothetical protein